MELINRVLVEAGYFRARITSLSDFDKIIGGMAWAMQLFRYEISIDISYADSLDLGQKISLTERLVIVLIIMNCPYQIQPHQIVGLDYVNILPVIKWLIGKFVEVRRVHFSKFLESHPYCRPARSLPDDDNEYQMVIQEEPLPNEALTSKLTKSLEEISQEKKLKPSDIQSLSIENPAFPKGESDYRLAPTVYPEALENRLDELSDRGELGHENSAPETKTCDRFGASNSITDERADTGLVADEEEENDTEEVHRELDSELLATNQKILNLVRKLDAVPNMLEIEQYQSRYIELHQQLISKSKDLKKFYVLFNTLDSSKHYLTKEVNLLDSIMSNLHLLNNSETNKALLIAQLQDINMKIQRLRNEMVAKLDVYKQKYELLISEHNRLFWDGFKER